MRIFRIFRADTGTTKFCKAEFVEDNLWYKESLFRNRYRSIHEVPIVYCVKNKCNAIDDNFFVLKEKSTKFLCTEVAKEANENAGLTGIGFEELELD